VLFYSWQKRTVCVILFAFLNHFLDSVQCYIFREVNCRQCLRIIKWWILIDLNWGWPYMSENWVQRILLEFMQYILSANSHQRVRTARTELPTFLQLCNQFNQISANHKSNSIIVLSVKLHDFTRFVAAWYHPWMWRGNVLSSICLCLSVWAVIL